MKDVIRFENISYQYEKNGRNVLKNISLTVKEGEFLAILGHNGSGKSTLAKHANGILLPNQGKVFAYGMDTADDEFAYQIRQKVGMVFQNPDNQIVATVVEEDVAFAPENLGVPPAEIRKRVDDALAMVKMSEFKKFPPHKLSGGQKQRIAIAGCLAMKPRCIVLDEPTAMLDPRGRKEVMDTIHRLNKEENTTVILITHYMNEAILADRIIVMEEGESVIEGTPREVFSNVTLLKSIRLDVPVCAELMNRLSLCGVNIKKDILNVNECVDEIIRITEV